VGADLRVIRKLLDRSFLSIPGKTQISTDRLFKKQNLIKSFL
jgi:hypothetical protein